MDGPALSEEEHEVVLNEERPVVTTEAVPVERVRLAKDQVQDEQTVTADVRKEVIDTDGDAPTTGGHHDDRQRPATTPDDDPSLGDKARGLADKAKDKLADPWPSRATRAALPQARRAPRELPVGPVAVCSGPTSRMSYSRLTSCYLACSWVDPAEAGGRGAREQPRGRAVHRRRTWRGRSSTPWCPRPRWVSPCWTPTCATWP